MIAVGPIDTVSECLVGKSVLVRVAVPVAGRLVVVVLVVCVDPRYSPVNNDLKELVF